MSPAKKKEQGILQKMTSLFIFSDSPLARKLPNSETMNRVLAVYCICSAVHCIFIIYQMVVPCILYFIMLLRSCNRKEVILVGN